MRLERTDFFAQHLGLALLQADRPPAMGAAQANRGQQLGMAVEKIGRVHQKLGDVVFGDGVECGWFHVISGSSVSPWKTVVAAPVMRTDEASPDQEISSVPPRACTTTSASSQPKA